jgi:hypothetical protein
MAALSTANFSCGQLSVSGFTRDYMEAIGMLERLIGGNIFMCPRKSCAVATGNRLLEASGILAELVE